VQVQINTDHNIDGREALATHVESVVADALGRFREHITRVEVHLSDENGDKNGQHDKRCMMEARLEGRRPIAVTDHAETIHGAVDGAAEKLQRVVSSTLERLRGHQS
jgi:ribosomal subunit interface protein